MTRKKVYYLKRKLKRTEYLYDISRSYEYIEFVLVYSVLLLSQNRRRNEFCQHYKYITEEVDIFV